jgi:hypothetical protein
LLNFIWRTHQVLNHSKQTQNDEDTGAQTKEEQHPIFVPFVTLLFAHPMTQKLLNLVKE